MHATNLLWFVLVRNRYWLDVGLCTLHTTMAYPCGRSFATVKAYDAMSVRTEPRKCAEDVRCARRTKTSKPMAKVKAALHMCGHATPPHAKDN